MPPLHGFSNNNVFSRTDLVDAVYAFLTPLIQYQSPNGARIRLPVETGTHFDDVAAQLEGFARPLWAVGALLAAQKTTDPIDERLHGWIHGMANGTDPENNEYWGDVADTDQRMVEIEILAFALLAAPSAFLGPPDSHNEEDIKRRRNISNYLKSVQGKVFPQTNWLWFRVMASLALVKSCGVPYEEMKESMNTDLAVLDSFYTGTGWASDGPWNENGRQMDYYSGSFAIQFSQLMYVRYANDIDPDRSEIYRERAKAFATQFWRYFDAEGAGIPFGRSLTYRFAMGGFWAAFIMAEVEVPAPLTPGMIKGLLLRHLREWTTKSNIFHQDGTLNIGYHYPNMYMCEDYNSPQSPYWCLKSFCMLALPNEHEFWKIKEEPHPLKLKNLENTRRVKVQVAKEPKHILIDFGNHHFLLSSGQYCGWPLKATSAKYSKFAYSSAFGFSIPTGPLLQQIAPDNTLLLSVDDGESWLTRWKSEESMIGEATLRTASFPETTKIPTLVSRWAPSKASGVSVQTTLIPSNAQWPDWHVRVHKISYPEGRRPSSGIIAVEGGFAIHGRKSNGFVIPSLANLTEIEIEGGFLEDDESAFIVSSAGASGIRHVTPLGDSGGTSSNLKGLVLKPDANTNLMVPRTLIPITRQVLFKRDGPREVTLVTAVFAVKGRTLSSEDLRRRWGDCPIVGVGEENVKCPESFIRIRR